ncbi:hypothetical protein HGB24_02600 [Candidatus Saccharibacteria bacterium]|nr:hypothetical protein [Candidatus Saccharibacteria bacterium]
MKKTKIKSFFKKSIYLAVSISTLTVYYPSLAAASQITARSVVIGSSVASANTSYNFTFTAPTSTTIKSISFQACDTASGTCTQTGAASGFSSGSATLNGQPTNLGSGGTWTINTTDTTALKILNNSNTGSPSAASTVNFSTVHNPSATNSTFFLRITTYSDSTWTTSIDTGNVATSTAGQITVTASVDETLTFTLTSDTVALGTLSTSSTKSGTSTFSVATNASSGYSVAYSGNTLTSGANTITALSSPTASSTDTKQFGINLKDNSTPNVGSEVSGSGSGAAYTGYGTANSFKFNTSGETLATASAATNSNTFTISYIANIDGSTAAGAYSTVLTFVATANF